MIRTLTLKLLAIATVAFFASGCTQESDQKLKKIAWGGPKNISMLPIIAQENQIFQKNGLDSSKNYLQTGKITLDAVARGDIQFGIIVEATIAFAGFHDNLDVSIIAINQEKLDDAIVARKDHGINTPSDLIGKKIGITSGTNSQMFLYKFLEKNKISAKELNIINQSPPSIVASLNNGEIDAGSVWQPFRYNLKSQLGENFQVFNNENIYRGYAIVAVNNKYAKKNPNEVISFLKSLAEAQKYIEENKDSSIKILAREIDIDANVLSAIWNEYKIELSMDKDKLSDVISKEGQWIKNNDHNFTEKALPEYKNLITSDYINSLKK